jgi:hypothetical protein
MCFGLWAWTQRHALIENIIIDALAEAGFEAELDVISLSQTQARAQNVRIRREGQDALRMEEMRADYVWPDVRDLKFKRIEMIGAIARLEIGLDGVPTEDWIKALWPQENNGLDAAGDRFPENGVVLTDSTLLLKSPLGDAKLFIDAKIPNANDLTGEITLAPSNLSYAGYAAQGAGFVTLEKTGEQIRLDGQIQTETLSNTQMTVTDTHLKLDGLFDLSDLNYEGQISLDGDSLLSDLITSGPSALEWDGVISLGDTMEAQGDWRIAAKQARATRTERAAELANTLSLYQSLSVVPVTEHYATEIRSTVQDFLLGSDVKASGELNYAAEGFTIKPEGSVSISSARNQLQLTPRPDQNFYQFTRTKNRIMANMDARFQTPVNLTLTDIELEAVSQNGIALERIQNFSANLTTSSNWRAQDEAGLAVRLGPLQTSLNYKAALSPRRLSVLTKLDYDGHLPGGYVEGLNLDGRLDVRLYEDRQALDFTPGNSPVVTLNSMETPTSWRGEDISFVLGPTRNLFIRNSKTSTLAATLQNVDLSLFETNRPEDDPRRFDLNSETIALTGTLRADRIQDWDVEFADADFSSDTLPGPDTTAFAEQASLTARLAPDQAPQITLDAPSLTAETPLVRVTDMQISLKGTPERYEVDHDGGMIFIIGSDYAETAKSAGVASFPADGTVTFENGVYRGQTKLNIAKADNAEVRVDYTYQNGTGTADIDVPSILFTPKGLQPQSLIPAFRGKVARVDGEAGAKLNLKFADGVITESTGMIDIVDMDLGTAPGPITGLNTKLTFTSLFPLETSGLQTLTMDLFNPGLPLESGVVTFNLVPEGVKVLTADWPIGNGSFSLDPFTWVYAADENRVIMRVKDVALGDFINDLGNKKIQATGNVIGVFPIVVRGVEVLVEKGKVSVPDGGLIKYDPGPNVRSYSEEEAIAVLREGRSDEYAALAQDALREFRYRELSASIDGPLNGDVEIGLVFDGSNAKVLNRQPFRFDVTVKGELFNIARSFNSNAQVKSEILRQNGKLPEGTIIGN